VVVKLRLAARYEEQVICQVHDYYQASAVAHSLVAVAAADLNEPQARGEFLQYAPAIVPTLARLDEDRVDFQVTRRLHVELSVGELLPTWVTLDTQGRTAESIIEDICGCSLGDALAEGFGVLLDQATRDAHEQLERHRRETDAMSDPDVRRRRAELAFVDLRRHGGTVTVRFSGTLFAEFEAHLYRISEHGAEFEHRDLFPSVEIDRDFTLDASWNLAGGPGRPDQVMTAVVRDNIVDAHEEAWFAAMEELADADDDQP
jgi:hypothetical protein